MSKQTDLQRAGEIVRIEFHNQQIEAVEQDGKIWVSVAKVCDNLGIVTRAQIGKIKAAPEFAKGYALMCTPSDGGMQEMFCIDLDVFALWLGSISTSKVKAETRAALVAYKMEAMSALRRHFFGGPSHPNPSPTPSPLPPQEAVVPTGGDPMEMALVATLQAYRLAQEAKREAACNKQQIESQEQRLARIEQIEAERLQREREAARDLLALPEPTDRPIPRTLRDLLVEKVRGAAYSRGHDYREGWRKLYREFCYRYHIDLPRRAKARRQKSLDVAQAEGYMQQLYNLACHLWPDDDTGTQLTLAGWH